VELVDDVEPCCRLAISHFNVSRNGAEGSWSDLLGTGEVVASHWDHVSAWGEPTSIKPASAEVLARNTVKHTSADTICGNRAKARFSGWFWLPIIGNQHLVWEGFDERLEAEKGR
jgi:hypothetical protein